MAEYVIARYTRLSLDDTKSESMSIENQRALINKHIAMLDILDATVIEFTDNGYSGTTFERPAVQELLELVRSGKIKCIIVKDFSRFGRNAIDAGYFLERVFPLYRVRFISITDGYDSSDYDGDTGGLDVALKLLVHEQYSKDLSKKIKSAKRARALRGEYIMSNCIHGYKKVENRMEIDEPAAKAIRIIFDLAACGKSLTEIAAYLYENKHPTPTEYKKQKKQDTATNITCVWNTAVICSVLANEQYVGTYISGVRSSHEVGVKNPSRVHESEWIKIPNHHPAIIDTEIFNTVQNRKTTRSINVSQKKKHTWERYGHYDTPLKGKVFCGFCGHSLQLSSTKNAAFHCGYTRAIVDAECHRLKITAESLERFVQPNIWGQAQRLLSEAIIETGCNANPIHVEDTMRTLYEKYLLGEISVDEYKTERATLDVEYARVKQAQAVFVEQTERKPVYDKLRDELNFSKDANKTTDELVDMLIDRVLVYRKDKVEIAWKPIVEIV